MAYNPPIHQKLPPQALQIEEVVLGALMLQSGPLISEAMELLRPETFYKDQHQHIFTAIQNLFRANKLIDILTVSTELKKMEKLELAGGPYEVAQLTSRVASAAHIIEHAHILKEQFIRREIIRIGSEAGRNGYDDTADIFDVAEKITTDINKLIESQTTSDEIESFSDKLIKTVREIEQTKKKLGVTGVPTGFHELDKVTSGWQPGNLITLAARPSMGKTSFLRQLALNAASLGFPGAYFTMEEEEGEFIMKMQASVSEIEFRKIKQNDLTNEDWERLNYACDKLSQYKIAVDDTPALKIRSLRSKAKKLKDRGELTWIMIDYLQLMNGSDGISNKGNREQEVSYISRSLKTLAKELKVPIITIASLSRDSEKRGGNKEPILSDLRDSGAIESDSDIVVFIHRPEYYNIMEDENGRSTQGLAQLIFRKFRSGSLDRINFRFFPSIFKFVPYDANDFEIVPKQEAKTIDIKSYVDDGEPF